MKRICHHCGGLIMEFRGDYTCSNCGRSASHVCQDCKYDMKGVKVPVPGEIVCPDNKSHITKRRRNKLKRGRDI